MKSYCNCPNCGKGIELHSMQQRRPQLPPGFTVEPRHTVESAIPMGQNYGSAVEPPRGMTATKRTPTRAPNVESDITVPLIKSFISGLFAQVIFWIVVGGWLAYWNWVGFWFTWILFLGLSWLAITRGIDSLMYVYEEITSDPEPTPQAQPTQQTEHIINLSESNGTIRRSRLPDGVDWHLWVEFCYGIVHLGKSFGRNQWARGKGKIMSDDQHKAIIQYCENQNLITVGEGGKYSLTHTGQRSFRAIADQRTKVS